ncbi:hypothetical protein HY045_00130 [Candidatus Woesebacteria bacterium]|nr:hypothetical protein [Candidatus Woesebacteria bacterium]
MINNDYELIKLKIKGVIAVHIGVEAEDIHDDDDLREDLHMNASDLTDLVEKLGVSGFEITKLDLSIIETVDDLVDAVSSYSEL